MSVIDDLAALQDHDGIIRELEQQVNDIPIRRNQELEKIKVEHEDYERAKEVVQTLRTEVTRGELYSAELKETIQKFRIQTPSLKTQAALDAMMSQISKAEGDLKAAENSVIETHLKIEPAEKYAEECRLRYEEAKAEVDEYIADLDARFAEVKAKLDKANKERLEKIRPLNVPATKKFLMYYERLRKNRWPVVIKLVDNVCMGCHMELPPAKQQDARKNTALANDPGKMAIVACDFCGRIVY